MTRRIADTLTLRVLCFVLLGFGAVATPAYFAFEWIVNSTVVQLGRCSPRKTGALRPASGLATLIREVSLAETLSSSQAIRDWARQEDDPDLKQRGLAELEHFRRSFADGSYFFVIDASGNYYFNDAANAYAGDQLRYAVKPTIRAMPGISRPSRWARAATSMSTTTPICTSPKSG